MDGADIRTYASSFNSRINAQDLGGLSELMTDDHVFIDAAENVVSGKRACLKAWQGFFAAFPDYKNTFDSMHATGDSVAIVGRSSCSDPRLDGPALWRAKIRGSQISEWRVFEDTKSNRVSLGLQVG
jgi:ketosteroid isomerase-like protein